MKEFVIKEEGEWFLRYIVDPEYGNVLKVSNIFTFYSIFSHSCIYRNQSFAAFIMRNATRLSHKAALGGTVLKRRTSIIALTVKSGFMNLACGLPKTLKPSIL
jgi:hypothetical protein